MDDNSGTNGPHDGEAAPLRDISRAELDQILLNHKAWLDEGRKNEELRANLASANLRGADLSNADLTDADLTDAVLEKADLRDARLRGANLSGANLTDVRGLTEEQLALTDLSNATLPKYLDRFDGLDRVGEGTVHAKTMLVSILVACLYSCLTIRSASHLDVIKDSLQSKVPQLDMSVNICLFFLVMPFVLLGLYVYLHLGLTNLFRSVAALPAVFQDGLGLEAKTNLWMLDALFQRYRSRKTSGLRVYDRLGFLVCVGLMWWIVPITLLVFWEQYLAQHDKVGTTGLTLIFGLAVFFGVDSFRTTRSVLRGEELEKKESRANEFDRYHVSAGFGRFWKPVKWTVAVVVLLFFGALWPFGAPWPIAGVFESFDAQVLGDPPNRRDPGFEEPVIKAESFTSAEYHAFINFIDSQLFVDLRGKEVSVKEQGWQEYEQARRKRDKNESKSASDKPAEKATWERHPPVKPALLEGRNLRGLNGVGVFLVKAELGRVDLRRARLYSIDNKSDLEWAQMVDANLQRADLRNCRLRQANCEHADLEGADLCWADLTRANLTRATLRNVKAARARFCGANLSNVKAAGACFLNSDFRCASLQGADLEGADLTDADFADADLRGAILSSTKITQKQLDCTCCDDGTIVPTGRDNNRCLKNQCARCEQEE